MASTIIRILGICCLMLSIASCSQNQNQRLIEAAKKGDHLSLGRSLDAGADINARDEEFDATALCYAAWHGQAETIRTLVAAGANINDKNPCGKIALIGKVTIEDTTALMYAARNGHTAAVQALLDAGAEVNAKNVLGYTPLMLAAHRGDADVVKVLLKAGADVNTKDGGGKTALKWASEAKHTEVVELLKKAGHGK